MLQGDTDQETIELNMQLLGMSRERVQEALAIGRGEVASDIVLVGEDGQPLPVDAQREALGLQEEGTNT